LQSVTPTSITVAWRTNVSTDSRVRYGTSPESLSLSATHSAVTQNHIVAITGLSPAMKYYYDVGSTSTVQGGGTAAHYFVTSPVAGSTTLLRVWVVGDSGTGTTTQTDVLNAMLSTAGAHPPDLALHVGDIAYNGGTDDEFTNKYFTPYRNVLRNTCMWASLGNHDAVSADTGNQTGPYYEAFVLPKGGEAGGVASGTEAYYSFDYGNVHFISLDSQDSSRSPGSAMLDWLASDLAATSSDWLIAFWHHPPYSKGTHDSDNAADSGGRMRDMRETVLPILEAAGVDLVLTGHSHIYERSYLIDQAYGYGTSPNYQTPDFNTLIVNGNILDSGDGMPEGDGAYIKSDGLNAHDGTVYVVAGHGGQGTGGAGNHPVMYLWDTNYGSCLLDVSGNTLTLQNVRASGVVSDTFQLIKAPGKTWREMMLCLDGPAMELAPNCSPFDWNSDDHVDLKDVSAFLLNPGLP